MILNNARVQLFANFVDSTEVTLEDKITSLVGKNESGKTAFLWALWRLNPHIDAPFEPRRHYPRWRWRADERSGIAERIHPITAEFELEADDKALIVEEFGEGVIKEPILRAERKYDGLLRLSVEIEEFELLKNAVQALPADSDLRRSVSQKKTAESIRDAWLEGISSTVPDHPSEVRLTDLIKADDLSAQVGKLLKDRLPIFFYFDEYDRLPGRFSIHEVLKLGPNTSDGSMRTAWALLRLGGLDEGDLTSEEYERRVSELEASGNHVTREVLRYWSQNYRIRVSFDVDKQIQPDQEGNQRIVDYQLEVRLHDELHGFTTNFATRSSGFRWFFSFLVAFDQFEAGKNQVIILLDEPGLSLHAKAQNDFLRFIEERLAPRFQVIYTTHSPFMIAPDHLERTRLVEDRTDPHDPEQGAVVTSDVLGTTRDTLFPLQSALGYELAQNLFIGKQNIVVEGTSDLIYLNVLSRILTNEGRKALDLASVTITPVGGATNVPTFVALLGTHLDVVVLVDSDHKLNQKLTDMVVKGLLEGSRFITIGAITGATKADIEDLFEIDEYLSLYNKTYERDVRAEDLPDRESDPIVKRLEKVYGSFDHGEPAELLLRNSDLIDFSIATKSRFEKLFERIHTAFASTENDS